MSRTPRLLVLGGAAAIALVLVAGCGDEERDPRPSADEVLAAEYPDLRRCVDHGATGQADEGFDVDEIAERVARLRGLDFTDPPDVEVLEGEELASRMRELFERDTSRAEVELDQRILTSLGAVRPDQDLYELYGRIAEEQVAGAYDPKTGELLVSADEDPGALERIVLAHELEHALADQALGLPIADDPDPRRADSLLARTALVEGDATLTMDLYTVRHAGLGLGDLLGSIDASIFGPSDQGFAELPYFVQQQLLWPYVDGPEFVCRLYAGGGWRAVDRAYDRPPTSTDQILFPGRYGSAIRDPRDPPRLDEPWSRLARMELGAAQLLWLFKAPGDAPGRGVPRARELVEPWRGGELHLWKRGADSALGIALLERSRSAGLCAGVSSWYASAFPEAERRRPAEGEGLTVKGTEQSAVIRCPPGEVRVGIAPKLSLARRLAS